ncbi:LANO_0C01574g1_1 [Lachancea nothofagi CBS 11611]|uniref:Eukaryotic translation initiation factor 5B n=1 Tax=Lachancea nothofagi CBS 11611 TaxID=1266666 RepID=A0A1G4J438_9SACH|nr:LANO_0C01574g1_1 [Lachancea nothofagi CBS 11611]
MAKKSKKQQQNYWDEEEATPENSAVEATVDETSVGNTPEAESIANGTTETDETAETADAEELEADFMSALKSSKKKADTREEEQDAQKPVIKSKKEKEKEKKEKEKLKKKEQAAKKKAQQQAQKEKTKELNRQQAEAAADTKKAKKSGQDEAAAESDAKSSGASKKNAKKIPAGLAALKRQLELKKQIEEQERIEREEEERLEKDEQERQEQQQLAEEEGKREKREKEKAKREKMKAEGKLLTRKQKEDKKLLEKRRAALLASGNITVAGLDRSQDAADTDKKSKKVIYGKKKKKSQQEKDAEFAVAGAKKATESAENADEAEEEALVDDWENLALEDDEENENGEAVEHVTNEEEQEEEEKEEKEPQQSKPTSVETVKRSAPSAVSRVSRASPAPSTPSEKDLRSPICCILGHVDTGKTKLLDKIRQTNVQGGEAGGITQQIGATYFPIDAVKTKTKSMAQFEKQIFDVPGLLVIDTPGHESFSNLRSRGSSLCNIAILVIDIMHGLEQQTMESIRLLRDRKAPFVVALNKIDRLYDWEPTPNDAFRSTFQKQGRGVKQEFATRLEAIKVALAEQGLNSELYFENKNLAKYVSIVPTSAVTGEGIPDLLWLLLELTQKRMSKQLMYLSHVAATILEVKVVEGFGTTIDVILSNGYLREGDRIVLCGLNGPIVTTIRALLTPQPLRELRLKSEYVHNKEVKAALGVKVAANDLEKAVSGSRLLVVGPDDDEEEMMDDVMDDLTGLLDSVDTSGRGVVVQASTLGSLEALLDFLKDMKIPVMSIGLGPVYKRDVMKATAMLDKAKELAVMLCFDVKIDREAEHYAEEQGVKIFNADIIYHLFDAFTAYQEKLLEQRRKDFLHEAIFPCVLNTLQIINKRGPMIIGVDVIEGSVRVGTPICTVKIDPVTKEKVVLLLGRVVSLEINHTAHNEVKRGQTAAGVAMRLEDPSGQQPIWGRHVDEKDTLYSLITRRSIDTLKDPAFRDQVSKSDWLLLRKLKTVFAIE